MTCSMVTGAWGNAGKNRGEGGGGGHFVCFSLLSPSLLCLYLSSSVSVAEVDNKTTGLWQLYFDRSTLPPWWPPLKQGWAGDGFEGGEWEIINRSSPEMQQQRVILIEWRAVHNFKLLSKRQPPANICRIWACVGSDGGLTTIWDLVKRSKVHSWCQTNSLNLFSWEMRSW